MDDGYSVLREIAVMRLNEQGVPYVLPFHSVLHCSAEAPTPCRQALLITKVDEDVRRARNRKSRSSLRSSSCLKKIENY